MTTKLFLLRHGETQANIEHRYQGQGDAELSELGLNEADLLAKGLADVEFSAIYSSTLKRSIVTAGIIAKEHDLEITQIPELTERNYGDWEEKTFTELKEKHGDTYRSWLLDPGKTIIPNAETLKDLQKRGSSAIKDLVKKHEGETICIVGHGGINRTILFHYMHIDVNNFWRIKQDNCCVNIIEFNKKNIPMVVLLNSTFFLGEKRVKKNSVVY